MLYDVWVQVPSTAPDQYNPNQIFQIGNGFGFFLTFHYDYFKNGRRRRASSKRRTRSSAITKKFRQSLITDSDGIFLMWPLTDFPVPRAPCSADVSMFQTPFVLLRFQRKPRYPARGNAQRRQWHAGIRRVVDDFLFPCHPLTVLIACTSTRRCCVPDVWRVPEFQAESALQSCGVPDNRSKVARHPVSSEHFRVWRYPACFEVPQLPSSRKRFRWLCP